MNETVSEPISGNLYVIAAPSGAGKTSLVKALTDSIPNLMVSISHTTRPIRPNEAEGVNYYFVDDNQFQALVREKAFLEHAIIFNQQYGTTKEVVAKNLKAGIDVILEIDWQGHQQIKLLFPMAISIFILPPSYAHLEKRLVTRNSDSAEIIQERLQDAQETLSHLHEFDYLVINDHFAHALHDLKTIIEAERLRCRRQTQLHANIIQHFFDEG